MEVNEPKSKKLLILGLCALIALCLFFAISYYNHLLNQREQRKTAIENQKAEEITIRIIEGWSNQEIGEYLEKQSIVPANVFLKSTLDFNTSEYENRLPVEVKTNLQGFLYPDTYRLFKSISDPKITTATEAVKTIINKQLETFIKRLPEDASTKAKKQGISLYEAITLASIIEKETGRNATTASSKTNLDEERKIVAGIFYNRLRIKMALQSDATINYITGKNDPSAELLDLEIISPYNTYKHRGLPPTPIGNPSLSSISAVLEPANTDYLYFLHKQPSGEPVYSKTFEEHVKNKLKYLK